MGRGSYAIMSSLLSFVGWAVLPNYVTSILQNVYYGITIRAGEPRPQPPSPRYTRHRRRIFILVVTSYLLYTLYEAFHRIQIAGDFYRALGVSPLADERTIKSRFRRLAAQHHPDKVGYGDGSPSDDYFVYLRMVQDTLLDPAKRFAYDRFGPDVLAWGNQKTMQDFLFTGLQRSIPQYVGGFITVIILNFAWWSDWGRYWRFFTFGALMALELALITHPRALFIPGFYIPPAVRNLLGLSPTFYLLPYQILSLAQRASVTLHIFISQLTPPEVSSRSSSAPGERLHPQTLQRLAQLTQLSRATDGEATRLLQLGCAPFRGDREGTATLRKGMREGLVLSSVKASPEVQQAVAQVMERRKADKNGKSD
ncbi:J domain-containing protein [Aspergillus clavatus NRRL 1]|uniref:Membrane associated DnaJ chaperone, putative n=1 Tax=Aspergillus clavatus (strain ATCC 1007 / CBS 513.65 / DSM 816 / NCTC 3887 / NRRL 1 / QM 1276 / 107) TaxID=344612 RepID=A1CG29_ASPCL|nr:membrane associated DnaJ chaperone, putative [Aspergillus clavatus NRRL 1]EAW10909.1 membrane associated DnaJ chaperone, putative [Aspergillus clavatus NRRL 1]